MNIKGNFDIYILFKIKKLENGGDMKLSRDFERSSIRQGFVLETEKLFYSETFSLYGFNFELIVEQKVPSVFEFYIQVD